MSQAMKDVLAERHRQVQEEEFDYGHDFQHTDQSLALAAVCYALPVGTRQLEIRSEEVDCSGGRGDCPVWRTQDFSVPRRWPKSWSAEYWNPKDRRRDLVRAAALLIAEIERLDRGALTGPNLNSTTP